MVTYYATIYEGVGNLTDCPQLAFLHEDNYDDELEEDYNEIEDDDVIEDDEDYYSDYDDYNVEESESGILLTTSRPAEPKGQRPTFSQQSGGSFSDHTQVPDPASGSVIAEPPIQMEAGAGGISKATIGLKMASNSQTVIILLVMLCNILQDWLL